MNSHEMLGQQELVNGKGGTLHFDTQGTVYEMLAVISERFPPLLSLSLVCIRLNLRRIPC